MSKIVDGSNIVSVGAVETVYVDLSDFLRAGETLTGTPTIVEVTTANLTLTNKAIIGTSTVVPALGNCYGCFRGDTIAASKGVIFSVSPSEAGLYSIKVTCSTTGVTETQTLVLLLELTAK